MRSLCYTRILPLINPKIPKHNHSWNQSHNCWICERWQEHTFICDPLKLSSRKNKYNKVSIALSYEKWILQDMVYDDDDEVYKVVSMVPPGKQQYC